MGKNRSRIANKGQSIRPTPSDDRNTIVEAQEGPVEPPAAVPCGDVLLLQEKRLADLQLKYSDLICRASEATLKQEKALWEFRWHLLIGRKVEAI